MDEYYFQAGDTVNMAGTKIICASYGRGYVANFILPFYSSKIPESGKCFTNGRKYPNHTHSKAVLTEKTYPFFARNNKNIKRGDR